MIYINPESLCHKCSHLETCWMAKKLQEKLSEIHDGTFFSETQAYDEKHGFYYSLSLEGGFLECIEFKEDNDGKSKTAAREHQDKNNV